MMRYSGNEPMQYDLPKDNIAEVTLIGTGGGYGESVVIHLGNQSWIVIDSCIDPYSKDCLPLEYLKEIGVNLKKDVIQIVCTHWHDDHIKGISNLLNECESVSFCMARPADKKKFLQFVGLDYGKVDLKGSISSTIEVNECIEILRKRNPTIINAIQDRLLIRINNGDYISESISLSPSDYVIGEYDKEISTLITAYGTSNSKIVIQTPNDKSVALFIKIHKHRVLLGSDLEVSTDNRRGWLCILDNNQSIDSKSSLFKIPHHGSRNGYHTRIWDELLVNEPFAKLTPWNVGSRLPKKDMLKLFRKHTSNLFISSEIGSISPKKRDKSLAKAINKFNPSLFEVKYNLGIIRCRIDILDEEAIWNVALSDKALHLDDENIEKFS